MGVGVGHRSYRRPTEDIPMTIAIKLPRYDVLMAAKCTSIWVLLYSICYKYSIFLTQVVQSLEYCQRLRSIAYLLMLWPQVSPYDQLPWYLLPRENWPTTGHQPSPLSQCWELIENVNKYNSYVLKMIQHVNVQGSYAWRVVIVTYWQY